MKKILSKVFQTAFCFLIAIYQFGISPLLGKGCRHNPSCSQYAYEAIQIHGVLVGLKLTWKRLIRCHPGGTWGDDPVPPKL